MFLCDPREIPPPAGEDAGVRDDAFKGNVMHVLNRAHIEKTVEDAIPAESEFLSGAIPEKLWRAKEPLTVVFTSKKGEVGLMNVYAGVSIVEMGSRYGAVGNPQR